MTTWQRHPCVYNAWDYPSNLFSNWFRKLHISFISHKGHLSPQIKSFFTWNASWNKFAKNLSTISIVGDVWSTMYDRRCAGSTRDGARYNKVANMREISDRERRRCLGRGQRKLCASKAFSWRRLAADFASDTPRTVASSSFPFTAVAYVTSGPHRLEGLIFRITNEKQTKFCPKTVLLPRQKIVDRTDTLHLSNVFV